MINKILSIAVIIIIFFLVIGRPLYTVDETEQVIITQFGRPIGNAITEPGLHFKVPFIQKTSYFAKNLLEWDGDPGQIPTKDKTFIWVDTFARWRIVDPLKFYKAVNNEIAAQKKLDDILNPTINNFIASNDLIEAVRSTDRLSSTESKEKSTRSKDATELKTVTIGRVGMTKGILEQAAPKLAEFGIEIVDFRIKRINYVEEVRQKVYERMIAERNQISEKFRSEGKGESKKIQGEQQKELRRIQSEAYKKVEEIKGKADAEATNIYAQAFGKDPEFYSFINTLEIYKKSLDENIKVILSTNSDFFQYLKQYDKK
jgi:membrane protease subunit HflC